VMASTKVTRMATTSASVHRSFAATMFDPSFVLPDPFCQGVFHRRVDLQGAGRASQAPLWLQPVQGAT
jgi:hypothetical protein